MVGFNRKRGIGNIREGTGLVREEIGLHREWGLWCRKWKLGPEKDGAGFEAGFVIVIQRRGEVRSWERGFCENERLKSLDSGRRRGIDVKKENRQGDRNTERRGAGFCRERVL